MENYKQWMEQKLTSEDMDKLPKVVKPISNEKIIAILKENNWNVDEPDDLIQFARFIEEAHGIVQKQKTIGNSKRISMPSMWY